MKVALSVLAACGLLLTGCSASTSEEDSPPTRETIPSTSMPMRVEPGMPLSPEEAHVIGFGNRQVPEDYWHIYAYGEYADGIKVRTLLATYSDETEAKTCRAKLEALVTTGQTIFSADSNGANQAC